MGIPRYPGLFAQPSLVPFLSPKKHLHEPAQYQQDVAAQKTDSSAHKQERSALVGHNGP